METFLLEIVDLLVVAEIPYMVVGSHSSGVHGRARTTEDVDFVIDPNAEQLARFLSSLGDRYYTSPEGAREALARRSMFNVIDYDEGYKADLIVRKARPFSVEEFRRRQAQPLYGRQLPVATAEDVILSKLEWNRITPSERQIRDAFHVASVQRDALDRAYLRHWAAALGVTAELERVLTEADALMSE